MLTRTAPRRILVIFLAALCLLAVSALFSRTGTPPAALAAEGGPEARDEPTVDIHVRDTYDRLPLLRLKSETVIDGPLARTTIIYTAENANAKQIEAVVDLHVPQRTVLTGFGYWYGDRFIPGKMYDREEAWKIYSAVTSRGRDPGVMDRQGERDYHAQIFPVAPKRPLRVRVELVQLLRSDRAGSHFELPLVQGSAYREADARPFAAESRIAVRGHEAADLTSDMGGGGAAPKITREDTPDGAVLSVRRTGAPLRNLRLTIRRETSGVAKSLFCGMTGAREGFYALSVSAPRGLDNPRIVLQSRPGTSLSMPTRFGDLAAYDNLHVVGRYTRPVRLQVTVYSRKARPISFPVYLSGERVRTVRDNPAAALWADKRIAQLKDSPRRDFRPDIIRLSKRFMVVSDHTALLAIPAEELAYYQKVLAKRKVATNTQFTGGGGGDPYIAVKAPEDAARVVAVFPGGDIKDLAWDGAKSVWSGRFDIPFGTPAGEYRVTVIVVHRNGFRSRFVLVYQNLLSAPALAAGNLSTLTAHPGGPVRVSVRGATGVARAVAVAPWGERVTLVRDNGGDGWTGLLTVPPNWTPGRSSLTLVLLDGAHNRTEVTLDLEVR